jgi:class 3 adenylate cyclase
MDDELMPQKATDLILLREWAKDMAVPVWIADSDESLFYFNEPAAVALGLPFDEAPSIELEDIPDYFKLTAEDGTPLPWEAFPPTIALRQRLPAHRRIRGRARDDIWRTIEVTAIPLRGPSGRYLGAMAIFWEVAAEARVKPASAGGPVTLLITDMEGSTTLTQRLGDEEAQELLRSHNAIVRYALKAHSGHEIKHMGDGIMASFQSASRALETAVAIQRDFDQHNEANPDAPIRVRIGLNTGEPVEEGDDLFGTAVQLAFRLCTHAQPGQILAADVVQQLAAGKGFDFADEGEATLKGFEKPVRLHEVRWHD